MVRLRGIKGKHTYEVGGEIMRRIIDIVLFHVNRGMAILYNHTHKQAVEALPEAVEATAEEAEAFFRSYNHQWDYLSH